MEKIKKYLIFAFTVALLGEIYFYPINSSLRISAGIIALNLIILIADGVSGHYAAISSGIAVFILRSIVGIYFSGIPFSNVVQYNFPSIIYYFSYGFLVLLLGVRKYKENFLTVIFLFGLADSLSNVAEILIRERLVSFHMVQVFVITGLARSIAAYFVYILYKNQELYVLRREHQKRYGQLNILISDIQAEMFYLKKSMRDIEKVMSKSYKLYEKYKENEELQEDALDIAREVHEIKKDYHRVLNGFQSFLKGFENNGTITLKDMLSIIKDNTNRYLSEQGKKITIHFDFKDDFQLKKYYSLFTILNNLITNSIDACGDMGIIRVWEKTCEDSISFCVEDNGEGIEADILPYIFNPGFTTKYHDSGKPSTGIGLSHVRNIVDELQGSIDVKSDLKAGAAIEITIPKNSLLG